MFRRLQVVAVLLCMFSFAAAATVSIGTASARGDMRVDSYLVKGNATLFDGSVVETGQASANLRLDKGAQITLSTSSRGILYRDRLVLERGESELAVSTPFQLEANGLRVTPDQPKSHGLVSMKSANTVEVAALTGSFGVTNNQGVLLASVRPGRPLTFAMQAGGTNSAFTGTGVISFENGQYFVTVTSTGVKYQLIGKKFDKLVGKTVTITGNIVTVATPADGAAAVISVASWDVVGGAVAGMSSGTGLIVGGVAVAGGAGLGVGIYEHNQPSSPASR